MYLRNGRTDLHQIHTEDVIGPSLGWIWMSRSKVKGQVTRDKNALGTAITPGSDRMEGVRCKWCHEAADGTIPSLPGVISAACVQFMFGKTSLALDFSAFGSSVKVQDAQGDRAHGPVNPLRSSSCFEAFEPQPKLICMLATLVDGWEKGAVNFNLRVQFFFSRGGS